MFRFLLVLSVGFVSAIADCSESAAVRLHGLHYEPPRTVYDIRGRDHNDQPFILSRRPQPFALVVFGYVTCTDVCSTNLIVMDRVFEQLGTEADQVQFVFVSIDPEKETPQTMKERMDYQKGETVGVTGKPQDLFGVYDAWGIIRNRVAYPGDPLGRGYKFDHTGQIFLVQGKDRLRVSYPYGIEPAEIAADLKALIADPSLVEARMPPIGEVHVIAFPPLAYSKSFQDNPTIPSFVRIHVGDEITWRNDDFMHHNVGDIILSPGDSVSMRYESVGDFYYLCTATPGEALRISVRPVETAER
jgi:protein SCO1/2